MSDEQVLRALQALAASDRDKQAAPEVEARLQQAFRRKRTQRAWKRATVWTMAAAAAVAALVASRDWRPRTQPVPQAVVAPAPVAAPVQASREYVPPVRKVSRARRAPQPHEVVTEFFPLLDAPPPFERGELVRVNLPATAMQMVGLPVREDRLDQRVQADVLVGEEGLARAIRFVRFEQ